jgi:hypothetical protein
MKNKFLIGTVAFVAVLAAIGILAISFTMTPVLATNATNGTETLGVGCTVAIDLDDNTSSGGNGSETQEAFDNIWKAMVFSNDYTSPSMANINWAPSLIVPDTMTVFNIGNDYVSIAAQLLSDDGLTYGNSFTVDEGGVFSVNAYGTPFTSCTGVGSLYNFTSMAVSGSPVVLCPGLDWNPAFNTLIINDRWILGQVTPDTYSFLMRITATDASCGAPPAAPVANVVGSTDTPAMIFAAADNDKNFKVIIDAGTATIGIPGAAALVDVAALANNITLPANFAIATMVGGNSTALYTPLFNVATQAFVADTTPVFLAGITPGDVPVGLTSNNGDYGAAGTGVVYIIMTNAGVFDMYAFTAINPSSNTATPVFGPVPIGGAGIPATATVNGFAFKATGGFVSYTDGGKFYIATLTGVVAGAPVVSIAYESEIPVHGLTANWGPRGLTPVTGGFAFAALDIPGQTFAANPMYIATGITGPVDTVPGATPNGYDWLTPPPPS